MQKILFVAFILTVLLSYSTTSNANDFQGFGHGRRMGMGAMANSADMKQSAYRLIIRAANSFEMAKLASSNIENGTLILKDSKKYYEKANKFYENKKYVEAAHYAAASMCLSSAITHIYQANTAIKLPNSK